MRGISNAIERPLFYILILLVLAFAVSRSGLSTGGAGESGVAVNQLEIVAGKQRHAFKIEMAVTPDQRSRGLMNRRNLGIDAGMLFDYGKSQYVSFWMKNTLIPLDMMFIKGDGRIVRIAKRTVPLSLAAVPSGEPVRAVFEVNGGTADRLGIAPGDTVIHPIFGNAD